MFLRYLEVSILLTSAVVMAACANQAVHRAASVDDLPPSMVSQPGDRHILAGKWEYEHEDGAVVRLTLDEQGDGHYDWKDGRFRTHTLIGRRWKGIWFQKENDRAGGFVVDLSPDLSEGEGRWWYSRIGADYAPTHKGGTFHLRRKAALVNSNTTPPAP